jgi:hypothetical protein
MTTPTAISGLSPRGALITIAASFGRRCITKGVENSPYAPFSPCPNSLDSTKTATRRNIPVPAGGHTWIPCPAAMVSTSGSDPLAAQDDHSVFHVEHGLWNPRFHPLGLCSLNPGQTPQASIMMFWICRVRPHRPADYLPLPRPAVAAADSLPAAASPPWQRPQRRPRLRHRRKWGSI